MSYRQDYLGWRRYQADLVVGPHRLVVALGCLVGDRPNTADALLDTAADWCVLPPDLNPVSEPVTIEGPFTRLSTRFGTFTGTLVRIPVHFLAEEGEDFTVEATWFVAPDW